MDATSVRHEAATAVDGDVWLRAARARIERTLATVLELRDEERIDPRWTRAQAEARAFVLRPAKRLRPALVVLGWHVVRGGVRPPAALWRFAAGVELLHAFLLVHDDVADAADTRRGAPALHHRLGGGRKGQDLAIIVGDHLFARAIEVMLGAGLPRAAAVVRYYLGICRLTAAGQYLDVDLSGAPLGEVTLFQTLRVALLKTARYGFVAPLVAGAMLGGGEPSVLRTLERVGRQTGIAFQLRDDLLGLFGDADRAGKPCDGDLAAGKPTFPVVAAYAHAPAAVQQELAALWSGGTDGPAAQARARALVEAYGGRAATERAVARASAAACRGARALPFGGGARVLLADLVTRLAARQS